VGVLAKPTARGQAHQSPDYSRHNAVCVDDGSGYVARLPDGPQGGDINPCRWVGFVFTADDPLIGIDLDDCRNRETGDPTTWASQIITQIDSYTEVSPSETGYHIPHYGVAPLRDATALAILSCMTDRDFHRDRHTTCRNTRNGG